MDKFKRGSYRAKLVRRQYIPKGDGKKMHPLGIPVIEDKLLQSAVKRIPEAIYEQDFLRCSYGYRPGIEMLDYFKVEQPRIVGRPRACPEPLGFAQDRPVEGTRRAASYA